MGKDEDATAGATESGDVQDFQEDAEKRKGASFQEEAASVMKSDPATDVEGEIIDKLSDDKDEE